MKKRWILLSVIAWLTCHLAIFLARFGRLPPLLELGSFVPTAILGVWTVHALVSRSRSAGQTTATVFGALLLAPVGLWGNLIGGLSGPLGITVYGTVPLTAGAVAGWLLGKRFNPQER